MTGLIVAHAVCMVVAWAFLIPGGMFVAAFAKARIPTAWFPMHWGTQVLKVIRVVWLIRKGRRFVDNKSEALVCATC
jgi:TRAP-type C4-dicarboxylate transport system permease small subunit